MLNRHLKKIEALLLAEHSKVQMMTIVAYVGDDHLRFQALMTLFLTPDRLLNQRASWPLGKIVDQNPDWYVPYLEELIFVLEHPTHNAVIRNTLKILERINLPEIFQGRIFTLCSEILIKAKEPVANKVYAMSILYHISKSYPELQSELKLLIETQWPESQPGFKSRGSKILKAIDRKKTSVN